jgi:SH3 domain protein
MIKKFNFTVISMAIFLFSFMLLSALSFGETWYVKDSLKVTIRAGNGTEYKILGLLSSGDSIEIIGIENGWAKIQLKEDKIGWVLARYLIKNIPKSVLYNEIEKKYRNQLSKLDQLKPEIDKLKEVNKNLEQQLLKERKKNKELNKYYEELKDGAGSYLSLKKSQDQILLEIKEKRDMNQKLVIENQILKRSQKVYLLISGTGILLLGWLIGSIIERRREKSKSKLRYDF